MGSGVPSGASLPGDGQQAVPTSIILSSLSPLADAADVPAGASLAADASPPSSICDDPPAGTTNINTGGLEVVRLLNGKLKLPAPKRLSNKFSERQIAMREKAADVGLRFASSPGVRKARLDTPVFIKLFTTLVHRESGFEPRAVSPVGARGLGQLMPSTARALGVKDSFAPDENLVGAATYLTDMLDKFGSPELALAAYNAGPGAVEKYRGIPPYRETRQYVADIFHEILREPHPLYVTARVAQPDEQPNVDVLLTALAVDEPVPAEKDAFATVLKETPRRAQANTMIQLAAYAGTPETATVQKASFKLAQASAILPRQEPEKKPEKDADGTPASATDDKPLKATPAPPDLSTLPEPRVFVGELSKAQQALRDTAVDIALAHAKASGVENAGLSEEAFAALFVALIRRESSFNDRAVSLEGAKGLGQLKPETLRDLGVKDPFSARENLEASATHFVGLLDEFRSPALALAAYNAGAVAVQEKGALPDDLKTRQFIADVLHDIRQDPLPDFVVARLDKRPLDKQPLEKQPDVLVATAAHAMQQTVASELARRSLDKTEPEPRQASGAVSKQSAKLPVVTPLVKRPALAATMSPIAFSDWVTGKLTFGKLVAAVTFAFLVTGFCSLIADLSGGRRASPDRKQASPSDEGHRPDAVEGTAPLALVTPDSGQDAAEQHKNGLQLPVLEESKVAA
jgi:hypothetical protein